MSLFATPDDVAARYDGEIPDGQLAYIDQRLSDAELVVTATGGDITSRIIAGKTTAAAVRLVLCNMVIRILRNADGVRTQTVGPFSYTLDMQVASGRLFVSREDRRLLGLRPGASTVTLTDDALPTLPARPVCRPWTSTSPPWCSPW